jgi:hypothetical protein
MTDPHVQHIKKGSAPWTRLTIQTSSSTIVSTYQQVNMHQYCNLSTHTIDCPRPYLLGSLLSKLGKLDPHAANIYLWPTGHCRTVP